MYRFIKGIYGRINKKITRTQPINEKNITYIDSYATCFYVD